MKKIKIGDTVKIILGRDKGKIGKIEKVYHQQKKIVIKNINIKIKHNKKKQKDQKGTITKINCPLSISNVLLCTTNGVASRVGFIFENGKKIRILKKTQEKI